MLRKLTVGLCAVGLVLMCARTGRAEDLEAVKKKIHDKVSKYKTMQFKIKTNSTTSMAQMTIQIDAEQTVEAAKKDGKAQVRTEMKSKMNQKMGKDETKSDSYVLAISDGALMYSYTEAMGMKQASKNKFDPENTSDPFDALRGFKVMEKTFKLKLLPDTKVDGKDCWAIEGSPTGAMAAQMAMAGMSRSVTFYEKGTGIVVKAQVFDKDDKPTTTSITSDIKLDADIKPDRFVFKAPAGVEVKDMTKAQSGEAADRAKPAGESGEKAKEEDKPNSGSGARKPGLGDLGKLRPPKH